MALIYYRFLFNLESCLYVGSRYLSRTALLTEINKIYSGSEWVLVMHDKELYLKFDPLYS